MKDGAADPCAGRLQDGILEAGVRTRARACRYCAQPLPCQPAVTEDYCPESRNAKALARSAGSMALGKPIGTERFSRLV